MPSTFLSLNYHNVFSTKDRDRTISPTWIARLHEYLGGSAKGLDAKCLAVGGTADHIHLLVSLRDTHRLSDFIREIKKGSSTWVQNEVGMPKFAWQEGYGAFTVSPTSIEKVRTYIANQEEHHRTMSFREEFTGFLQQAGIDFEDKYLD